MPLKPPFKPPVKAPGEAPGPLSKGPGLSAALGVTPSPLLLPRLPLPLTPLLLLLLLRPSAAAADAVEAAAAAAMEAAVAEWTSAGRQVAGDAAAEAAAEAVAECECGFDDEAEDEDGGRPSAVCAAVWP